MRKLTAELRVSRTFVMLLTYRMKSSFGFFSDRKRAELGGTRADWTTASKSSSSDHKIVKNKNKKNKKPRLLGATAEKQRISHTIRWVARSSMELEAYTWFGGVPDVVVGRTRLPTGALPGRCSLGQLSLSSLRGR